MALPASRDVTVTPASTVPPSLYNNLQDCAIGAKHGTKTKIRSVFGEEASVGTAGPSSQIWRLSTGGQLEIRMPELNVGCRVLAVRLRAKDGPVGGGGSVITARLQSDVDGTRTTINTQATAGTNVLQTITFAGLPIFIAAGTTYFVQCSSPTTTTDYYRVEVDYDAP